MYSCSYQGYKRKWNESEPRSGGDANSGTHSQVSLADVHIFWCNGAALFGRKPTLHDTVSLIVYFTCISHPGWLQHLLGSSLIDSDAAVDLTKFLSSHILHSYGKIGLINKVIPDNEMLWEKKGQCVPIVTCWEWWWQGQLHKEVTFLLTVEWWGQGSLGEELSRQREQIVQRPWVWKDIDTCNL